MSKYIYLVDDKPKIVKDIKYLTPYHMYIDGAHNKGKQQMTNIFLHSSLQQDAMEGMFRTASINKVLSKLKTLRVIEEDCTEVSVYMHTMCL